MNKLKLITLVNTLLLIGVVPNRVVAQDVCQNEEKTAEIEELCKKISELTLDKTVLEAEKDLLNAEKDLIGAENALFKSKLPDFSPLNAPEGTTTVNTGALKFESLLLAKVVTQKAVKKLLSDGYLKKDLITERGNRIYLYSGSGNESEKFFQYYQKYDYFNIQYNAIRKGYADLTPKIQLNNSVAYFNLLRGIESQELSISVLSNIPAVIGTLIEAKNLFNVDRTFSDLNAAVELDMLVGEIYQQFKNEGKNEIYYPKLHSLEKKGLDTIIENIIELIALQQDGIARLADESLSDDEKAKIMSLNNLVTSFLSGSGIGVTANENTLASINLTGNDAIPTITQLAKGYSIYQNINNINNGTGAKKAFILYLEPSFGGNFIDSKSLFSTSKKVSGGLIIDYQLYQIDNEDGFTKIQNAGSVSHYIEPIKIDDNLAETINEIAK